MFSIIKRDLAADLAALAKDMERHMNEAMSLDLYFEPLGRSFPKVNITEHENQFLIEAALPGYKKEQVKIEVTEQNGFRYLTLKGEKSGKSSKNGHSISHEVHCSSFHRSWTLPAAVDVSSIKTKMEDGILEIEIPKNVLPETKREIKIN